MYSWNFWPHRYERHELTKSKSPLYNGGSVAIRTSPLYPEHIVVCVTKTRKRHALLTSTYSTSEESSVLSTRMLILDISKQGFGINVDNGKPEASMMVELRHGVITSVDESF